MTNHVVGFDSLLFNRREIEDPNKIFKALMAVGITVEDKESFNKAYDEALLETFKKEKMDCKKPVYKSYHFCRQTKDDASKMICTLLEKLSDEILRIDVYCGFYSIENISIFGEAYGQTVKRMTFLERNQHGFHHVCAWKYSQDFGNDYCFDLDHFEGRRTPAWDALEESKTKMSVYYSGSECNSIISISDLVLKLIQLHQHGHLSTNSLFNPIKKNCPSFRTYGKLAYHEMKKYLKMTTPIVPHLINFKNYIKHPIYFMIWNPNAPRTKVKPMFEWSPTYTEVVKRAYENNGCVKFFSNDEDHLMWTPKEDYLVAWSKVDEEVINWIKEMGYKTPNVLTKEDILQK